MLTKRVPPNFIASGADAHGAPHVKVFDAATGALRAGFYAYDPKFFGGVRVAVGDVKLSVSEIKPAMSRPAIGGLISIPNWR